MDQAGLTPFEQLLESDRLSRDRRLPAAATEQRHDPGSGLALRVGSQYLLFPLEEASEIITVPRITPVPGVKTWLLGITNLRGTVVSVVDLKAFLNGRITSPSTRNRVVVVRAGEWSYGLLVEEVYGMRNLAAGRTTGKPEELDAGLRPYVPRAVPGDDRVWLVFDTQRLLQDPRFLGAAG